MKVGRDRSATRTASRPPGARSARRPSCTSTRTARSPRRRRCASRTASPPSACGWFEEPVSSLDRRRPAACCGRRCRRGWTSPPASTRRRSPTSACSHRRGRLPPGRRHALRRRSRAARGGRARRGLRARPLRPHARRRSTPTCCAAVPNLRHLEWFHDHVRIERLLFDGFLEPGDGALAAGSAAPGPRRRAEARRRGALRRLMPPPAQLEVDAAALERTCGLRCEGEVRFAAGDRALYALDRLELPPGPDRRRDPADDRRRRRRGRPSPRSTARRSSPAAAARAWPGSASTSPSCSTSRST